MLSGTKLKQLREAKNLSLEMVACYLHAHHKPVTRQTINNWELGVTVPNANNLEALTQFYGVSMEELFEEV